MNNYDLIIIGGGPGGYIAANYAAKNHLKVALVEADHLGGTCLNTGCIPSKMYLEAASSINAIANAGRWGISLQSPTVSLANVKSKKDEVVQQLRNGVEFLMKQGKIDVYSGFGRLHDHKKGHVLIEGNNEENSIEGKHILIATGSKPVLPPIDGIENEHIMTTDTIFSLEKLPTSLTIVGGGVIGVEFATMFSTFGTKVTLVEAQHSLLFAEDIDAAKILTKKLENSGVTIYLDSKVNNFEQINEGIQVHIENEDGIRQIQSEKVLVAVGRKANLSAVNQDVKIEGSYIEVNERFETSIANVYAIGDVIGGMQLAHVASAEGIAAINHMIGKPNHIDLKNIPRCIYTEPEIAAVGLTEQQLQQQEIVYKKEIVQHRAVGKALVLNETTGFTKILYDPKLGEVLGMVIVGPNATEMITEATVLMNLEGTITELANIVHPHPTMHESIFDAAISTIK